MQTVISQTKIDPVQFLRLNGILWVYLYLHEKETSDGYKYDHYEFSELESKLDITDVKTNPEKYIPKDSIEDTVSKMQTHIDAMSTATDTSIEFLEDCLMEMAGIVYAE